EVKTAASLIGLQIQVVNASTSREIDAVFATLAVAPPDALFVGPDPFFYSRRGQLALQAARHAIPASYAVRDYAEAGGVMSYGTNITMPITGWALRPPQSKRAQRPPICRCSSQPSSSL